MKFSNVSDWLSWLETLHPSEIELGLERINPIAQALNVKDFECPVVVISGTNGKGSCLALLESISLAQGYNIATYSSPHLFKFNERIRFNGQAVDDQSLIEAFERVESTRKQTKLTYFEFSTLAALTLYKQADLQQKLDLLVLEVGLGGRLDAVNVVNNDLAVITSIAYDHIQWLGETLEEIGLEKAGIFRSNGVAIIGEPSIPQSVIQKARSENIKLLCIGEHYSLKANSDNTLVWQGLKTRCDPVSHLNNPEPDTEKLSLRLPCATGSSCHRSYQSLAKDNIATVLQVLHQLPLEFQDKNILAGLENVKLPGRFEILPGEVITILDVAHNPAAAKLCAEKYQSEIKSKGQLHIVVGALDDKDLSGVLSPFIGLADIWYPCNVPSVRSASASILYNYLLDAGCSVPDKYLHPKVAYNQALANTKPGDNILVYGSFYTVMAIKNQG